MVPLRIVSVIFLVISITSCQEVKGDSLQTEHDGKALMVNKCYSCHNTQGTDNMLAPPMFRVKDHYIYDYVDKNSFVNAIVAWVQNPQDSLSMMPGAKRKFGLMPKQDVPEEELRAIAGYLYEWDTENETCGH